MYLNGIYGDCAKDVVIDHAVTLIAYGKVADVAAILLTSDSDDVR